MRGDPHENAPFTDRLPHPFEIGMLQVSEPTMYNFMVVGRRRIPEIPLIH
jgi:hypothetical protein